MYDSKELKPDTPYRKTYVLKQETPMIHFQHRDSGVIIRASEFKPKLDKFLLKKLRNAISEKQNWFLKQADENKTPAFNYKVRIYVNGEPQKSCTIERDIEKNNNVQELPRDRAKEENRKVDNYYAKKGINGMYFGNIVRCYNNSNYKEDVRRTYKETIFYNSDIYVEIQCFIKGLLKCIDENIEEFLLVTNFGTRQSKGFGCFSLKKGKNPLDILNNNQYNYIYCEMKNDQNPLDIAAGIYAVMKGGVNRSRQENGTYDENKYIKGYIQRQYLDDRDKKDIGSDKAFIKAKVYKANIRDIEKKTDNFKEYSRYEYVRAILGISESIEFKYPDKLRKGKVTIKDKNESIKRFQSAIQIVVSGNYVILIMTDSYKAILGKEFIFGKESRNVIKVPSDFEPKEFLSGFVTYFNKQKTKLENVNYKAASQMELKEGGTAQ